jgi:hypothetical protein
MFTGACPPFRSDARFMIFEGVAVVGCVLLCGGACGCGYDPRILRLRLSQTARQAPLRKTTFERRESGARTDSLINFFRKWTFDAS